MAQYPILLDLRRVSVLVVGGGSVALRKVHGLVAAGGMPVIISPSLHESLGVVVSRENLSHSARPYESGDTTGHHLVFAATSDSAVNGQVARDARESGALVDVADDPEASSFHLPAVVREGRVVLALSTGGASPLLSRRLRERMERILTPGLGRAANRLHSLRQHVRTCWPEDHARRRTFWFNLVTPAFVDSAIAGNDDEIELQISRCLSQL